MKIKILTLILIFFFPIHILAAKEIWILDKELSTITFDIPVFLLTNVKGKFNRLLLMPNCYHGANSFESDEEERLTLVMFFHRIAGEPMPIERMRAVRIV